MKKCCASDHALRIISGLGWTEVSSRAPVFRYAFFRLIQESQRWSGEIGATDAPAQHLFEGFWKSATQICHCMQSALFLYFCDLPPGHANFQIVSLKCVRAREVECAFVCIWLVLKWCSAICERRSCALLSTFRLQYLLELCSSKRHVEMYLCVTISDFLKFGGFPWQSLEEIDKDENHPFKIVPWQCTLPSKNPLAYCTSRSEF